MIGRLKVSLLLFGRPAQRARRLACVAPMPFIGVITVALVAQLEPNSTAPNPPPLASSSSPAPPPPSPFAPFLAATEATMDAAVEAFNADETPRHRPRKHREKHDSHQQVSHHQEKWSRLIAADELPDRDSSTRDALLLIAWLLAPICAVLLLVCVAPLDVSTSRTEELLALPLLRSAPPSFRERWKGEGLSTASLAGSTAGSSAGSSSSNSPTASRRAAVSTPCTAAPASAAPRPPPPLKPKTSDDAPIQILSACGHLVDDSSLREELLRERSDSSLLLDEESQMMRSASHEGRLSMIEADRLRKLEDSRQQRQLDLLRVLHILFPPLSRWLPLDRSSSNLRSSSSYSNLDAGSIMPHTPGMGSARERTPKSVRRGVVTPAAIDSVKRMLAREPACKERNGRV